MAGNRQKLSLEERLVSSTPESVALIKRILSLYAEQEEKNCALIAQLVGKHRNYVWQVVNGLRPRGKKHTFNISQLELRYSDKLCRRCGDKAGIIAKSRLCIKCELHELAKNGAVTILTDEIEEEEFAKAG